MITDTQDGHPPPLSAARAAAYERALPGQSPYQQRLASVRAAANPLFEAAAPLLRALSDIPSRLDPEGGYLLRRLLDREVLRFQSLCKDAQIRHEHHIAASYAMCTAIDEAAGSTDWGGGRQGEVGLWSGDQLAIRFHGDNKGGDKVFLLLGRLAASPQQHIDLIEVLYALLGLGFEGRYGAGGASDARRQLDTVRHRIFFLLAAARAEVPVALSPHGRGPGAKQSRPGHARRLFGPMRTVPLGWATGLYLLVLGGLFTAYRLQLDGRSQQVLAAIHAMGALQPPARLADVHPLRLKALLEDEITRGLVSVDEDETHSAVSFRGDGMFAPGQAHIGPGLLPTMAKLAQQLNEVAGKVEITGHSDDQPIRTPEFPDNQHLSLQRASAVAAALQAAGVDKARLTVTGRGDTQPLADNQTAAGRARNRRVDLVLQSR